MNILFDIDDLLPGNDWQRLETWAALAEMTPLEYVRTCIRRGHLELRGEVSKKSNFIRPAAGDLIGL